MYLKYVNATILHFTEGLVPHYFSAASGYKDTDRDSSKLLLQSKEKAHNLPLIPKCLFHISVFDKWQWIVLVMKMLV